MRKKIWITVGIAGWVILIGLALYSFGYKAQIAKHQQEGFNQGANNVINSILTQIQTQGEITITTNQGIITLVKKETKPNG